MSEGRTLFLKISTCFSKVINQMKKPASNQLEDVLKVVCFDMFKIIEKYMWKSSFFSQLQDLRLQLY